MEMCYLACAYRTPSGFCGSTGGAATCPHRQRKTTNADQIRAMSDEELALEMMAKGGCPHDCEEPEDMDTDCRLCWLDWLRQEVKE